MTEQLVTGLGRIHSSMGPWANEVFFALAMRFFLSERQHPWLASI